MKTLELDLLHSYDSTEQTFFQRLPDRVPGPNELVVTILDPSIGAALSEGTGRLIKLKKVSLPPHLVRPRLLAALSGLPELCEVNRSMDYPLRRRYRPSPADIGGTWSFSVGSFAALHRLEFDASLDQAAALFTANHAPAILQELDLRVHGPGEDSSLCRFFSALSKRCPILQNLTVDLVKYTEAPNQVMTFNTLTHLFACNQLKDIEIKQLTATTFIMADIEQLSIAWPRLSRLVFTGYAYHARRTKLSTLSTLAKHLGSQIRIIGMAFTVDRVEMVNTGPMTERFELLGELDMMETCLPREDEPVVIGFLGLLCPRGVRITVERGILDDEDLDISERVADLHRLGIGGNI